MMWHAGGPSGLGEDTVGVVLEIPAAGGSRQPSEVCIRHLSAWLTSSQAPFYCHCGLLCKGFDPICTDSASSQNEMRQSLSLPAPSFSQAATCGACGNLVGMHSGATQGCRGEHLYPVGSGVNGHGCLPLPPLQAVLRLTFHSSEGSSGLEHPT